MLRVEFMNQRAQHPHHEELIEHTNMSGTCPWCLKYSAAQKCLSTEDGEPVIRRHPSVYLIQRGRRKRKKLSVFLAIRSPDLDRLGPT